LCNPESVTLLNGGSQIYPLLQARYADTRVLMPRPIFGEYERIFPHADHYDDRVGISTAQLESKAESCQVVIVVNPNNPTGSVIETPWLIEFAGRHPNTTVIIDESFIEFAPTPSIIPFLEKQPLTNVIVLKSLSKVLGVPGLRLGFMYACDPAVNDFIRRQLPVWNSNSIAECFLEILLKHRQELERSYAQTIHDRERFAEALESIPKVERVFTSAANFLLVQFKDSAKAFHDLPSQMLATTNIYLKDVSSKMADGRFYLRLAVRLPEENQRLVVALRESLG
jgi:histidinol-phosphate/aromatic aminotransferase/cobyric acid decarboxylase-like protein